MAEKEVKIKVTTETDMSQLNELKDTLNEVKETASEVGVSISDSMDDATSSTDETTQSAENLNESLQSVDGENINEVTANSDELQGSLDDTSSSAEGLSDSLANINGDGLGDASEKAKELGDNLKDSEQSADSLSGVIASVGAGLALDEMVNTAGRIGDSWNRLELTFGQVTGDLKQDISSASAETGRAGGLIRGYFNDMGVAGVKNTDLLRDSFISLSGRAYQTGNSIETMESALQRMVLSGNAGKRQLVALGLSTEDLGRVMGVTGDEATKMFKNLSQEERLRVLTEAMGDGTKANEMYKNSWEGVKEKASAELAGLMGAIGTPILQMLIPVMQTLNKIISGITDAFKALPQPVQSVLGAIGGLALGMVAFVGVLGTVGKVIKGVSDGIKVLRGLSAVKSIVSGLSGAFSALSGAISFLVANPIVLLVIILAVVVASIIYLYYTNEEFRNSVNGLIDTFKAFAGAIYSDVMGAIEWLQGAWQNTVDWFTNGANAINDGVMGAFNWLRDGIVGTFTNIYDTIMGTWQAIVDWLTNGANTINDTVTPAIQWLTEGFQWLSDLITGTVSGAIQWLTDQFQWLSDIWNQVSNAFTTYAPLIAQVLFVMATGGVGAIVLLVANFMGMPNQIGGALQSVITRVASFVSSIVSRLGNGARQAVSNFASGISNLGQALRDELQGMLNDAANFVGQIGQIMWNAAVNAWNNFLSGLDRHSPGKMMREFKAEIGGILQTGEDAEKPLGESMMRLGQNATRSFNTAFNNEFTTPNIDVSANNNQSNIEGLLNRIIEALNNIGTGEGDITFNLYGDMDKESRMQEFLEYVRKYLEWKNDTAGRTV